MSWVFQLNCEDWEEEARGLIDDIERILPNTHPYDLERVREIAAKRFSNVWDLAHQCGEDDARNECPKPGCIDLEDDREVVGEMTSSSVRFTMKEDVKAGETVELDPETGMLVRVGNKTETSEEELDSQTEKAEQLLKKWEKEDSPGLQKGKEYRVRYRTSEESPEHTFEGYYSHRQTIGNVEYEVFDTWKIVRSMIVGHEELKSTGGKPLSI